MRPVLSDDFEIVLRRERAYVERSKDRQIVAALTASEAVILHLMNGRRTEDELVDAAQAAVGPAAGTMLVREAVGRLKPLLKGRGPRRYRIDPNGLAKAKPPDPGVGIRRLPGPRVLHWSVTQVCPRRCAYCFVDPEHGSRPHDATVTRDELTRIFDEAASLGAEMLLIGGAEPMLRADLPEIMGDAVKARLTPLITTKHPITADVAHRLAAACVRHVSLSVDTMDAAENAALIGSARYPAQVRQSARNLKAAGVEFSLQVVMTRINPDALDGVAAFAAEVGARVMQVVPFEPVRRTIAAYSNEDLLLDRSTLDALPRIASQIQERHPSLTIELFEKPGAGSLDGFHCDIGQTKLFFLPNGIVHRCYKLTEDETLRGADLRRVSVAKAWHDPEFGRLIAPPREAYAGTGCGSCGRFSSCHREGRCIYQAAVDRGRYQDRDRACNGPYMHDALAAAAV
jgi:pyrroloquinoline quinone biosynthesis protein E